MIASLWHKFTSIPKGQGITNILIVLFVIVIILAILPTLGESSLSSNVLAATTYLENNGYVVFSAAEYGTINSKLDAIKVAADAATANATAAAIAAAAAVDAAQLAVTQAENAATAANISAINAAIAATKVDLFNTADTFLFPADTDFYVLLAADNVSGSFSTWKEIKDSGNVTLASSFSDNAGYISDIYVYQVTAPADTTHIVEIAYGESKTSLTRIMFNGDNLNLAQIKSRRIPAGSTIYYRIMTTTAPTEFVSIGFRYFYE